jgi:hypothetical protein
MRNSSKLIKVSYRILLSFLFVGYYSSLTLFYHVHYINGRLVSHSHPCKQDKSNKTPFESHSHSSAEYEYFQHLTETNWNEPPAIFKLPVPVVFELADYKSDVSYPIVSNIYSFIQLRAPPVNC